jgi:hypothetical protein
VPAPRELPPGLPVETGPYTVKQCMAEYLTWMEQNRKGARDARYRAEALPKGRAAKLVGRAAAWSRAEPRSRDDVLSLPGCGAYAADSWEMFVLGRQDVAPTDRALLSYRSGAPEGQSDA